jgi:S1-C subfamily serine protease
MKITPALIALLLAVAPVVRAEEDITKSAKKIFADYQDSVVWVSAVAKLSVKTTGSSARSIPDQEKKVETPGTIVDASGLVLASLSSIDPSSAMDGQEFPSANGPVKVSASAKITEVKIIMPDGTEIPGDVVMKDTDLDLAFIKINKDSPEAKGVKFRSVDLANSAEGHVLDEVVAIGRMGEAFSRQPSVITSLVTAETKKPRHFLRIPTETIGGPVFAASGKLIGFTILRRTRSESSGNQIQMIPSVLPAADIVAIAAQALKATPPKSNGEKTAIESGKSEK